MTKSENIGKIVIVTVAKNLEESTNGNYTISDFIEDFDGTEKELDIVLIKMAAKLL